jgi:hypothetical protein
VRAIYGTRTKPPSRIDCTEIGTLLEGSTIDFDNRSESPDGEVLLQGQKIQGT